MKNITVFKDFSTPDQPYYTDLETIVARIKGGNNKAAIEKLQSIADSKEADRLKKLLPCICFSGRFMRRNDSSLVEHSGLMVLDFDHKPDKYYFVRDPTGFQSKHPGTKLSPRVTDGWHSLSITDPAKFRDSMAQYPFVAMAFISPSGTGVKVVIRVPAVASQHRGHYAAILKFFEVLDPTNRNESRICFDSYDPDLYVGEEDGQFTDYIAPDESVQTKTPPPIGTAPRTDYGKLNLCAAMIRNSPDGGRHEARLKAARLAGGYIAAGVIDENAAITILEAEVKARSEPDALKAAFQTIRDGIEYGKREPIYEQIPEEKPAQKTESRNGVVYLAEVWDKMDEGYHNGKARGETTHYDDLDECFTWKPGNFTVVSGQPGSGKSEWVLQMMLVKSVKCGWKWGVFSPESYPADEFYDSLIHAYVGKSVDPHWQENQMSLDQYEQAANFIQQHFFFVYPDTAHTIEEVEANFLYLHQQFGINGVLVDPFNQLEQDFSLRDDQYLQKFITNRKRFAVEKGLHYVTIVHPKAMSKNKDGEYDAVDAYDLANGAMWINKTDNFISIHRPNRIKYPKDTRVDIHIKKIKQQKLVGIPGTVFWDFNRFHGRYYTDNGYSPLTVR